MTKKKVVKKSNLRSVKPAAPAQLQQPQAQKWELHFLLVNRLLMYTALADGKFYFSGLLVAQPMDSESWYRSLTQLATGAGRVMQALLAQMTRYDSSIVVTVGTVDQYFQDHALVGALGVTCANPRLGNFLHYEKEPKSPRLSLDTVDKLKAALCGDDAQALARLNEALTNMPDDLLPDFQWLLQEACHE